MKFSFFFVFVFLLSSCGKNLESKSPTFNSLDSAINYYLSSSGLPGVGVALIQRGVTKEMMVAGLRKKTLPDRIQLNDKFHLGSCSKAMTATLAAILVEEGQLQWNSTLSQLLPDLELHPQYQNVTFDMLLAHRSGLRRDSEDLENDWLFHNLQASLNSPKEDREFFAQTLLKLPPTVAPGQFNYSNGGYIVAGHIMDRVTGKSWETLMKEKVFLPLGMNTCGFGPTSPNEIWAHRFQGGSFIPTHSDNPVAFNSAARIHCSLMDWSKFLQQHIDGFNGKDGLITATSFSKLHTPYPGGQYTYGGWIRVERDWAEGPALNHSGSNSINYANVWLAPKRGVILMSATNAGGDLASAYADEAIGQMVRKIEDR